MQQNVILAVSYPIISRDSVKFVKEVLHDKGNITFVAVNTPDEAQRFGGEVGAVADFLSNHVRPTLNNTWKFTFVDSTKIKPELSA